MTREEICKRAGTPGSEKGLLGQWPKARLPESPEAGLILNRDGHWYVAVAGVRREGTRGDFGGLYARWVEVPEDVCAGW